MKYRYLYQTGRNENRDGWIEARDRAEAYALLRKRGIRPYRVIGDDPPAWRAKARAAALAACVAAVAACTAAFAVRSGSGEEGEDAAGGGRSSVRRAQLPQSPDVAKGLESAWEGVFSTRLDRFLAAYAQPGWIALPPEPEPGDSERFLRELAEPLDFPEGEDGGVRLLRRIVAGMRGELSRFLADGGGMDGYFAFLEERQEEERETRKRAHDAVAAAPASARMRLRAAANTRLRDMGLEELHDDD